MSWQAPLVLSLGLSSNLHFYVDFAEETAVGECGFVPLHSLNPTEAFERTKVRVLVL